MGSLYEKAMELYNSNKIAEAKEIFLNIIKDDDKHHYSINMLGFISNLEGDFKSSSRYIKKAVDLAPQEGSYRNNLGVLYLEEQKYEQALEQFLEAIKYSPSNSEAHSNAGYVTYIKGDFEKAKGFFEKALSYNPANMMAYLHGAAIYRNLNQNSQALGLYSSGLSVDPKNVELYIQRGNLYFELKLFNEALDDYSKAIELEPKVANTRFIKGTINQIYSQLFPANRFSFYNDNYLLEKYQRAIKKLSSKDIKVLEYSNVEGILSMVFAKNGVKNIDLILDEPFLIFQAKKLLEKNILEDKINIIEKGFNEIELDKLIKEKANLLVVDLFNNIFPSYSEFMAIENLKSQFLKENGKVFPSNLKFMVQPICSKELREKNKVKGFLDLDISIVDQYRPLFLSEDIDNYRYEFLSDPYEVYNFDLSQIQEKQWEKNITIPTKNASTCDGFILWVDKILDTDISIDNSPSNKREKSYYIYLLDQPKKLEEDKLEIKISYSNMPILEVL